MQSATKRISKVLLIDDDQEEFEILQTAINDIDPGISIQHLNSFSEEHARTLIPLFDLLFIDINMTPVDGFTSIQKIRSAGSNVPVVMYSTTMNQSRINKSYECGAN